MTAQPTATQTAAEVTVPSAAPVKEPLGRRFHVHLSSVAVANLADGMVGAGVPLIAVGLTRSPAEISMLSVVLWLPWLLFGIVAGVVVDRTDRRLLRIVGMTVRAGVLGALTVAAVTDRLSMPILVAGTALYGLTTVFVDLAGRAIVPQLAPRSRWSAANGRVMAAEQVTNTFVGGPVGGALLVLGAGWVMGVPTALAVLFVLLLLVGLRGDYKVARAEPKTPLKDVTEGLRFLTGHPVLRPLLVSGSLMNMASTAYFAVFVLWVVGDGSAVGLPPEAYPVLLALLAVGAVVGSVTVERVQRHVDDVPLMLGSWGVNTLMLLVPVLAPTPVAIGAAMLVLGWTNSVGNILGMTIRQRLVPTGMLGRIGGASSTVGFGLMPLGALLGGLVGETWGLPTVFVGATVIALLALLYPATRLSQRLVDDHELVATDS
jgi:MFS family permease